MREGLFQRSARSPADFNTRYTVAGLPLGVPDPSPGDGVNEAQRFGPVLVDPQGWYGIWLWWFEGLDQGEDHAIDLTQGTPP